MHLSQAKSKTSNNATVLGILTLIIDIGDFYQFPPIVGNSLWNYPVTGEEIHNKNI